MMWPSVDEEAALAQFDTDDFVAECQAALRAGNEAKFHLREIVERAVSDPMPLAAAVRERTESPMMTIWHRSDNLTVLHIVWPPEVDLFAHDHNMWAVIGIYAGREDNTFYRRIEKGRIEPHAGRTLTEGDVIVLGSEVIHSVANPTRQWTAALHVYGGEFFTTPRTMWPTSDGDPLPLDVESLTDDLEAAAGRARAQLAV